MMQESAIGKYSPGWIERKKLGVDVTHRVRFNGQVFADQEDVHKHMGLGKNLDIARRRVASTRSCYEFIKSLYDPLHLKKYVRFNYLKRDKYALLFEITDSYLKDIHL